MDLDAFKTAVGEFATGVAVVTGAKDDVPYGFTVQTFVSLSLKPALVSVCPAKTAAKKQSQHMSIVDYLRSLKPEIIQSWWERFWTLVLVVI